MEAARCTETEWCSGIATSGVSGLGVCGERQSVGICKDMRAYVDDLKPMHSLMCIDFVTFKKDIEFPSLFQRSDASS